MYKFQSTIIPFLLAGLIMRSLEGPLALKQKVPVCAAPGGAMLPDSHMDPMAIKR